MTPPEGKGLISANEAVNQSRRQAIGWEKLFAKLQ